VRSFGDHRIAMSMAIAGLCADGGVEIDDAGCVDISFPAFFDLLDEICLP
jgi:3-phosphoshikimate 1-carboxyvinyltransferase